MPRNVEIKARVPDLAAVRGLAQALASGPPELISQRDTFFVVPHGRLKVREFADGSGELILYHRDDRPAPKTSTYTMTSCADASALCAMLNRVLTQKGRVTKRRELFLVGRTRVHLDDVERLGSFVELEVVLRDGESIEDGQRDARELAQRLGIASESLVEGAYVDLLEQI